MRLLAILFLLSYCSLVRLLCSPGRVDGNCEKTKDDQFQLRGMEVVPMWEHVLKGPIRRKESTRSRMTFGDPEGVEQTELEPITDEQSGAESPGEEPIAGESMGGVASTTEEALRKVRLNVRLEPSLPAIARAAKTVELNRDPVDSFERAIAGDEFDSFPAVQPITTLNIEEPEDSITEEVSHVGERDGTIEGVAGLEEIPTLIPTILSTTPPLTTPPPPTPPTTIEPSGHTRMSLMARSQMILTRILNGVAGPPQVLNRQDQPEVTRPPVGIDDIIKKNDGEVPGNDGGAAVMSPMIDGSVEEEKLEDVVRRKTTGVDSSSESREEEGAGRRRANHTARKTGSGWRRVQGGSNGTGGNMEGVISGGANLGQESGTTSGGADEGRVIGASEGIFKEGGVDGAREGAITEGAGRGDEGLLEQMRRELEPMRSKKKKGEGQVLVDASRKEKLDGEEEEKEDEEEKEEGKEETKDDREEKKEEVKEEEQGKKKRKKERRGKKGRKEKAEEGEEKQSVIVEQTESRVEGEGKISMALNGNILGTELNSGPIQKKVKSKDRKVKEEESEDEGEEDEEKEEEDDEGNEDEDEAVGGWTAEEVKEDKKKEEGEKKKKKQSKKEREQEKEVKETKDKEKQERKRRKGRKGKEGEINEITSLSGRGKKKGEENVEDTIADLFEDDEGNDEEGEEKKEKKVRGGERKRKNKEKVLKTKGERKRECKRKEKTKEAKDDCEKEAEKAEEKEEEEEDEEDDEDDDNEIEGRSSEENVEESEDSKEKDDDFKPIVVGGENSHIRTGHEVASLKDAPNVKYYFPPKSEVPLPTCFHNPSGYVCCNLKLNNLIEDTYQEMKENPSFSTCNINKIAFTIQKMSENMFSHPFESVVSLGDFAQNVHFAGDLACKLEIDGKFMLIYGTPYDADHAIGAGEIDDSVIDKEEGESTDDEGKKGGKKKKGKKEKKKKITQLAIHNMRM